MKTRVLVRCVTAGALGVGCLVLTAFFLADPVNFVHRFGLSLVAAVLGLVLLALSAGMLTIGPRWARISGAALLATCALLMLVGGAFVMTLDSEHLTKTVAEDGPTADGVSVVVVQKAQIIDYAPEVRLRRGHGVFAQESVVYTGLEESSTPKARLIGDHEVKVIVDGCTLTKTFDPATLRMQSPQTLDHTDIQRCR